MQRRWMNITPIVALFCLGHGLIGPVQADVDVENLVPGLVTTYRDGNSPPHEFVALEPTVALNLKADEAPHPRLNGANGTYVWKGYINLLRAGNYRFQRACAETSRSQ